MSLEINMSAGVNDNRDADTAEVRPRVFLVRRVYSATRCIWVTRRPLIDKQVEARTSDHQGKSTKTENLPQASKARLENPSFGRQRPRLSQWLRKGKNTWGFWKTLEKAQEELSGAGKNKPFRKPWRLSLCH